MIWGDSDPKVWVEVLNSFSKLDIKTIVGGHGRPKPRQVIELWKNYLTEIISIVTEAKKNKLSLAQLQQQVSFSSLSSLSKNNFGEEIQQAIHINIDDAYDFNWEAEIDNVLASVWNFMGTKEKESEAGFE